MKKMLIGVIIVALFTALLCLNGCYFNYKIKDDEIERIELQSIIGEETFTTIRRCVAKSADHSKIMQIINTTKQKKYSYSYPIFHNYYLYIYYQGGSSIKMTVHWYDYFDMYGHFMKRENRMAQTHMIGFIIDNYWNADDEEITIIYDEDNE